ncbi:R3H domain [Nesidiocoris tenuis]|uniref:R3H domain n=1 Tax=Nesidiocoris tenuis TaxID=355587 RepID=A0ABN7ADM3_9HEMI|nr:R3H domain [Nesidiocoris tenuis]
MSSLTYCPRSSMVPTNLTFRKENLSGTSVCHRIRNIPAMEAKRTHECAIGSHTSGSSDVGIGAHDLESSDQPHSSPTITDFFRVQKRIGGPKKRALSSDDEEETHSSGPNQGSTSGSCRLGRSAPNDEHPTVDPSRRRKRLKKRIISSDDDEEEVQPNLPNPTLPSVDERIDQKIEGRQIAESSRRRKRLKKRIISSDDDEEEVQPNLPNPTLPSVDERIDRAIEGRQIAESSSAGEDVRIVISAPRGEARKPVTESGNAPIADENRVRVPGNDVDVDDADGQRQRLTHQLNSHSCECVICTDVIQSTYHIWPCRFCHNVFHLPCIRRWAKTNRGVSGKPNCWMCPICRHEKKCIPNRLRYNCFCGRVKKPGMKQGVTPHSCGNFCKKKCGLLCHPGPCLTTQPNTPSD